MTIATIIVLTMAVAAACAGALAHASPRLPSTGSVVRRRSAHRQVFATRRHRERVLDDAYPDALDLFVVSVQAGYLPHDALLAISAHVHPIIRTAIDEVSRRVDRGQRLADSLDALVDALGARALSFVATVTLAERTGLAIAPMIDRVADDARLHRRRRAEATARELPVRLTLPLVLCTLPSFVLIAIAPLLIGALSSLRGS